MILWEFRVILEIPAVADLNTRIEDLATRQRWRRWWLRMDQERRSPFTVATFAIEDSWINPTSKFTWGRTPGRSRSSATHAPKLSGKRPTSLSTCRSTSASPGIDCLINLEFFFSLYKKLFFFSPPTNFFLIYLSIYLGVGIYFCILNKEIWQQLRKKKLFRASIYYYTYINTYKKASTLVTHYDVRFRNTFYQNVHVRLYSEKTSFLKLCVTCIEFRVEKKKLFIKTKAGPFISYITFKKFTQHIHSNQLL